MKKKKPQTGKFSTRDELVQNIHFLFHHEKQNYEQIANCTGVDESIIISVLKPKRSKCHGLLTRY